MFPMPRLMVPLPMALASPTLAARVPTLMVVDGAASPVATLADASGSTLVAALALGTSRTAAGPSVASR
jgi:hypothetical protein